MRLKLGSIQALRAIAAGAVCFGHVLASPLTAFRQPEKLLWLSHNIATPLCLFGVDLFFVISGAIMYLVTRETIGSPGIAVDFAIRRAARIYPLFWVVVLANLGVLAMSPYELDLSTSLPELALIEPSRWMAVAWTLGYEIRFYLVIALAMFLPIRPAARFLLVGYVIVLGVYFGFFGVLMLEFLFGMTVGALAIRTHRMGWLSLFAGLLALGLVLIYVYPGSVAQDVARYRVYAFGPPAAFILYGAVALERSGQLTIPKWLSSMGDASYSIYLWHMTMITLVLDYWPRGGQTWATSLPFYPTTLALTAAISWLSWRLIERPSIAGANALTRPAAVNMPYAR